MPLPFVIWFAMDPIEDYVTYLTSLRISHPNAYNSSKLLAA